MISLDHGPEATELKTMDESQAKIILLFTLWCWHFAPATKVKYNMLQHHDILEHRYKENRMIL